MARTSDPHLGEVLAGKYRVERVLGQGGMGKVVAATHVVLGHQVALKYLLPGADVKAETIARFLREARVTARLKSVHVAKTLDMGQFEDGRPFLVMELLEGHDLGAELAERAGVPFAEVADWIVQACEGLAEAHASGIVHRDLKPSNLFLARDPSGAVVVKILDFGISKLDSGGDAGLTKSEAAFGSPLYMSPEQLRSSKSAEARSDIWSLGVILYEALAGKPPFEGETVFGLAQSIMADAPVPLHERRRDVPPGLSAVVMRCLAKKPADRPASVADLAEALAPFIGPGGMESAGRVRVALSDRVVINVGVADQSDKWTAAATQPEVTTRPRSGRRAATALLVLTGVAAVGAAFVGVRVASSRRASQLPAASSAPVASTSEVRAIAPPPTTSAPVETAAPDASAPTVPTPTATATPSSATKKKRVAAPPSSVGAPKTAPPADADPFLEKRTN